MFAGLLKCTLFHLHELRDTLCQRTERLVSRQKFVVFDDIDATLGCFVENLRPFVRCPSDVRLDHRIQQRSVMDSQSFANPFDTELRTLVLGNVLLRECHIDPFQHAGCGNVAEDRAQHHRETRSHIPHWECDLHDVHRRQLLIASVVSKIRHFIKCNDFRAEFFRLVSTVMSDFDPCAGSLFISDCQGQFFYILGLHPHLIGADDVVFIERNFRKCILHIDFVKFFSHIELLSMMDLHRASSKIRLKYTFQYLNFITPHYSVNILLLWSKKSNKKGIFCSYN